MIGRTLVFIDYLANLVHINIKADSTIKRNETLLVITDGKSYFILKFFIR